MLCISLSTGRSATRFWRKCIYANAVMLISRLRSFSPAPGGPGAYVFSWWYKRKSTCHSSMEPWPPPLSDVALLPGAILGDFHGPVTCVLGVLEGWNFLCIVTPSWGADHQNFKKKFDEKIFFCLISPTHYPAHNSCSTVLGVWNLLCVLTPLMRDRLPHFCFKIRRKLFIFSTFSKKNSFFWINCVPHNLMF